MKYKEPDLPLAITPVDIKIKLALLWTSLMFLYNYADYLRLMNPEKLEHMIDLQTPMGPTTPSLLMIFSLILIIPALMIILSILLKPKINKWLNITVASLYTCMSALIIKSTMGAPWRIFLTMFNGCRGNNLSDHYFPGMALARG